MSVLSSILLRLIEKELLVLEPEAAQFLIDSLQILAKEVLVWAEEKNNSKKLE